MKIPNVARKRRGLRQLGWAVFGSLVIIALVAMPALAHRTAESGASVSGTSYNGVGSYIAAHLWDLLEADPDTDQGQDEDAQGDDQGQDEAGDDDQGENEDATNDDDQGQDEADDGGSGSGDEDGGDEDGGDQGEDD